MGETTHKRRGILKPSIVVLTLVAVLIYLLNGIPCTEPEQDTFIDYEVELDR